MSRAGTGVTIRGGGIQIAFTYEGEHCRELLRLAPSAPNLKHAARLLAEIKQKIAIGAFSYSEYFGGPTVGLTCATQMDRWLDAQRIEPSTRAGYSSALRFWKAAIGDKPLRALRHSDVLTAIAARTLSGKTINNYVSVLRESCALAVLDGTLSANPVAAVPRAKYQKAPPDPFTLDEAERIIARMPEGQVRNVTEFRFFTGLRTSELAGLRWGNVDLASGTVLVTEALVRGAAKASTKTNVARLLDLNSRALAAVQRQRVHTALAGGHVFLDPRYGTPWVEERAYRRSHWEPTLRALGIRYRRPYDSRHTYATMLLMSGARPAYCARQLGHSVEMFLSTYAKWIDGDRNASEQARLEAFIKGAAADRPTALPLP